MITKDARCISEIKSRFAMAKTTFNKIKNLFLSQLELNLRKKLVRCYIWSVVLCSAENRILRKVEQNYLESFGTCGGEIWRRTGEPVV
jgi:hypothetical protein